MRIAFVGDSFTEGVGDEWPGSGPADAPRGWADRVVEGLAVAGDEPIYYANFAIRGRLLAPIAGEQLESALALDPRPDLIVFNGGGNNMMRPDYSTARCVELTRGAIDRCEAAGVRLVILSGPDPSDLLPGHGMFHRRGRELTDAVRELTAERGLTYVSTFDDTEIRDPRYWSEDRLHLNPLGHARIASLVLTALGVPTDAPAPGDAAPRRSARSEMLYVRRHMVPWVGRRLTGRSSGDGRAPKHAVWHEVSA